MALFDGRLGKASRHEHDGISQHSGLSVPLMAPLNKSPCLADDIGYQYVYSGASDTNGVARYAVLLSVQEPSRIPIFVVGYEVRGTRFRTDSVRT